MPELSIGLGFFGSGSGRAWISKNCRASIGLGAGAKSTFSVSDMVFTIAEIKQRKQTSCVNIAVRRLTGATADG